MEDEYYILQLRYKNIVYSYNTAFHLLGLSESAPYNLDVTTIQGKKLILLDEYAKSFNEMINYKELSIKSKELENKYKLNHYELL